MLKLKNISQSDIVLTDLGMQLVQPNDTIDLDSSRKEQVANSSQIIQLLSDSSISVIDHDNTEIEELTCAIDAIKGFSIKSLKTFDNKTWVQSTKRPIGTFTCFMSEGDNQVSTLSVGNGEKMLFFHQTSESLEQHLYIDFNVKENKTYMGEGTAIWKDCNFDMLHLNVVPKVTTYTSGTNTSYNLYGGFLIVPANNDGTIEIQAQDIQLVEVPYSIDYPTLRQDSGFWDADYNLQTHEFDNLRPNYSGTGQYNIFGAEIKFATVVCLILLDNGTVNFVCSDVSELVHGMRIKFSFTTYAPDHNWKCALNLSLNREHYSES